MVELIVTAINVFILFFLIGYLLSDMIEGMLDKRQQKIIDDIHSAKLSKEDALALKEEYEDKLAHFDQERARLLGDARIHAVQLRERIILDGQEEAERIVARADRESYLMKLKLEDEVKHDMIIAASETAKKLIAQSLDDKKQEEYIQEMLNEMGESTWQD